MGDLQAMDIKDTIEWTVSREETTPQLNYVLQLAKESKDSPTAWSGIMHSGHLQSSPPHTLCNMSHRRSAMTSKQPFCPHSRSSPDPPISSNKNHVAQGPEHASSHYCHASWKAPPRSRHRSPAHPPTFHRSTCQTAPFHTHRSILPAPACMRACMRAPVRMYLIPNQKLVHACSVAGEPP